MRQTYYAKNGEITQEWRHVDVEGMRLGRMATEVATVLMGKHRPEYTPHVDTGDFVIITNADKIVMTGKKAEQKMKNSFSGYPGGQTSRSYADLMKYKPEFIVEDAVRRMLPKSRLGRQMLKKLKVYKGDTHPHQAQNPTPLEINI